jgi:hypothetical protein
MTDTPQSLRLVAVRLSDDEIELLEAVQAQIAKLTKNADVKVTQRAAIVSALRLFLHEKTRREAKDATSE